VVFIHGRTAFVPALSSEALNAQAQSLLSFAAGRPVAAELFTEWTKEELVHALARLGRDGNSWPRLWIRFPSPEDGPAEA